MWLKRVLIMTLGFFPLGLCLLSLLPQAAKAEPINRWWKGFGQGLTEYGYTNGPKGSEIRLSCNEATLSFFVLISNKAPAANTSVVFIIDNDQDNKVELPVDDQGYILTDNHLGADNFLFLLKEISNGSQDVTYGFVSSDAKTYSQSFPLKGSGLVFENHNCTPDYYR
jgi:hypothetical protein